MSRSCVSVDHAVPCDLDLVDRLLWLRLVATRMGWMLHVEHVDDDLAELLELVGVAGSLGLDAETSNAPTARRRGSAASVRVTRWSSLIGVPSSTVRPTVHSWSCERCTACGSTSRAASPAAPSANVTWNVTSMSVRWLPSSSRTLSAPSSTWNEAGSARRDVRMSTSIAVHPPIAASSNSVGVKSASSPLPNDTVPPRRLTAANRPGESR